MTNPFMQKHDSVALAKPFYPDKKITTESGMFNHEPFVPMSYIGKNHSSNGNNFELKQPAPVVQPLMQQQPANPLGKLTPELVK